MRAKLKFPLPRAEEILRERIERGKEILRDLASTGSECTPLYESWQEYNIELLGRMFSSGTYTMEYLRKIPRKARSQVHERLSFSQLSEEIRCLSSLRDRLP